MRREPRRPERRSARSSGGTRGRGRRTPTRRPACSRARSGAPRASGCGPESPSRGPRRSRARSPGTAGQAPSGELNAKSDGVGSRNSRPQRGQCSPRRKVRTRSFHARLERAGQRERRLDRGRDLGREAGRDDEAADDERAAGPPRRAAAPTESPISTISPSGDSGAEEPGALELGQPRRRPGRPPAPLRGRGRGIPPARRAPRARRARPSSAAQSSSTARSTPPGTASSPQSGQTVVPPWAKSSRSESWISVCVPTVERALRTPFFCSSAIAGGTGSIESTSGRSSRSRNWRA